MLLNLYAARRRLQATEHKASVTVPQGPFAVTQKDPGTVFLRACSRVRNLTYTISDTTDNDLVHFTATPLPPSPRTPPPPV